MGVPAPAILPILRSRLVGDLLGSLAVVPDRWLTVGDLVDRTGAPYQTVTREVRRLQEAGIIESEQIGRSKRLRFDRTHPLHAPLAELVLGAFGPLLVVAEEFADLRGIDEVVLFGSWAARYLGERGAAPRDVDVLVLGEPDRDDLHAAARRAEKRLGVPVNTTLRRSAEWADDDGGFARSVKERPMVIALPRALDRR